jgi:hypothetical protein
LRAGGLALPGYPVAPLEMARVLRPACQARAAKIFLFTEIRNYRSLCPLRPKEEGRIAIVTTCGPDGGGGGRIGATDFAGQATVSDVLARTTGAAGVRQNR